MVFLITGIDICASDAREIQRTYGPSTLLTAASFNSSLNEYEPCRDALGKLLKIEGRPFVVICCIKLPTSISTAESSELVDHVLLTPTCSTDFVALKAVNDEYQKEMSENGKNSFLKREYGDQKTFINKCDSLYRHYQANPLKPLFYENHAGASVDLDFYSSVTFSIMGIKNQNAIVLGDLWLSHIDGDVDFPHFFGTTERSTMLGPNRSRGFGQIAVKMLNEKLVDEQWLGKPINFVGSESSSQPSIPFGNVVAYVEPSNAESIGNNFQSGGSLIGATSSGKYLIFKYYKSFDENKVSDILRELTEFVRFLYPSKKAIEGGFWKLTSDSNEQKRSYIPSDKYREVLAETKTLIEQNPSGILLN
jgi:hypothetical protein